MKSFFYNLYASLISLHEPYTNSQAYRRLILTNVCLYLSMLTMLIFAALHLWVFEQTNLTIGLLNLIGAGAAGYAIVDLRRNRNVDRAALIGTATLFVFFLIFFYFNQNHSFGLIWSLFFPIFAMSVSGPKRGLQFSLAFYLVLLPMAYQSIGVWQDGLWDLRSFMRLTIASAILTLIIYLNEIAIANAKAHEQRAKDALHRLSTLDELTQIANRRQINSVLNKELERARRYQTSFSFVIFDIDDFKRINDRYGHLNGDKVLKQIARLVKSHIRNTDRFGRWGGEEFSLILPEQNPDKAHQICQKLLKQIERTEFAIIEESITCSFGIAGYTPAIQSADELIRKADKALYMAKETGKNRVVLDAVPVTTAVADGVL